MTTKLTPSTDLQNVKPSGLGFEMLDSAPGAFVVLKECSYDDATRVAAYEHDGSAASRSTAFSRARSLADSRQDYSGEMASFNVYEETADESAEPIAPAARLVSSLNAEEARTVAVTARLVRQDIRRKAASLKALRAIQNDNVIVNPYHADRRERRLTPELWNMIRKCIGDRVDATCAALLDLEQRADRQADSLTNAATVAAVAADMSTARANVKAAAAGFTVGDTVDDKGTIRTVTAIRENGVLVLDHRIETTGASVQRIEERHASADAMALDFIESTEEPATDIFRMTYPEIIERMQIEKAQPCGTKPTARGFMALMITRDQSHLSPDRDTVCDILKSHLVNVYQNGVITAREFMQAEELATAAARPRDLLEALRVALLRGVDIVDALTAAAK